MGRKKENPQTKKPLLRKINGTVKFTELFLRLLLQTEEELLNFLDGSSLVCRFHFFGLLLF